MRNRSSVVRDKVVMPGSCKYGCLKSKQKIHNGTPNANTYIDKNASITNTAANQDPHFRIPDRSMRSSRSHSFSSTAKIESEIDVHPPTKRHDSSGEVAAASALTNGTVT